MNHLNSLLGSRLLLLPIFLLPAVIAAQPPGGPAASEDPQKLFQELDRNGDKFLAPSEAGKHRALVNRLIRSGGDKNGDGGLSFEEFRAALEEDRKRSQENDVPPGPDGPGTQPGFNPAALVTPQAVFARLDRNRDNMITLDELNAADRQIFGVALQRLDRDGDGVDRREFLAGWPLIHGLIAGATNPAPNDPRAAGPNPLFQALDSDGDGVLSPEEIDAAPEALRKLDANGDGSIELTELTLGRRAPAANLAAERRTATAADRTVKRLLAADADGDGKLSLEEAPEAVKRRFQQLDRDADGFLDADELRGARGREEPPRARRPARE